MVLDKKSVRIEEIASSLFIDVAAALQIVDSLQVNGEIEIKDGSTVIPAKKYRELQVPKNQWNQMLCSQNLRSSLEKQMILRVL
jgi:hypothetical protein